MLRNNSRRQVRMIFKAAHSENSYELKLIFVLYKTEFTGRLIAYSSSGLTHSSRRVLRVYFGKEKTRPKNV